MRIQNSLKNMFFGLSGQLLSVLMGFIVRTVFIYTLGIEYLGVDGLFTSILIMLSLANLGFDTAMVYSLYMPLAEKDIYRIQALMNLYQRAYRLIGIIVLLIGLSLLPILPYLINGKTTISNINIIYLLFLINSVASYYFIYKQSVIIADQRNYIISKIHMIFTLLSNLIQIAVLVSVGNYLLVLILQITVRIIENIYIANRANKLYPFLKEKNNAKLSIEDRKHFFENLYALLLYKISGVVINGTDNIVISVFVGITTVGMYSNYLLIIATLSTFLSYIFSSITASVGNLNVNGNSEKKYFIFRVIHFSNFWVFGFSVICLWNLINPFITLWLGQTYVFDKFVVFCILLNFFTAGMQNASTMFRDTTGLFRKGKYRPLFAALINIVVSIILVRQIGVAGVFLGTVISRLCTYFWYDPYVIHAFVFEKPLKTYFVRYAWFVFVVFVSGIVTDMIGSIYGTDLLKSFIIRAILCITISNFIFWILFRKTDEFLFLWNIIKQIKNKIPSRNLEKKEYQA